jgi:hypothetical protein
MAKENTPGRKQASETPQAADTTRPAEVTPASGKNRSGKKNNRLQVGGTAVSGAKSTQPKQASSTNSSQQQEIEGYNRTMRRRMQHMGAGPYAGEQKNVKTLQQKRKEKIERIKQRRAAQVQAVKRSLPGGKVSTDTRRVYYLIAGVTITIIAIIALFIILRLTHVLH